MNWSKAIILVFVLFAGFIGTMVYLMTRQRVDLVSDNYYQNEIDFQQHIDRVANARTNASVAMTYQSDKQQVVFVLPETLRKGEITFYRPGDRQQDFRVAIPADHPTRQVIPTQSLARGNWRVQFTWSDGQREYYKEEQVFL
ncbi:FixH family protein [Spirosoma koreense]